MGRPLSSRFFGSEVGAVSVKFHNGSSVVTGYVTRQMGSTRYEVTVDGDDLFVVDLVQTTDEAEALAAGQATIEATLADGTTKVYVKNLQANIFHETEGGVYTWNNEADDNSASLSLVEEIPEPTEVIAIDTIANKTTGVTFAVSGSFEGNAPTKLQYRINSGSWAVVSSPTIGASTFTFNVVVGAAGTGVTVSVRDYSGDVVGVSATSNGFNVVDPV